MTTRAEDDQDQAGLEASLEADLQELEREYGGGDEPSAPTSSGGAAGGGPGPVDLERRAPVLEPSDLEAGCELSFDFLMRRYAVSLGIPEEEIPEGAIDAEAQGAKIARALAPVANKYLPRIMGEFREEIEAVVVIGFATGSTMWRLQALAESGPRRGGPGEGEGDGSSPD